MRPILEAVVEVHDGLDAARIHHAFGGAFALLWCTGEPRTTVDIDLNVFVPPADTQRVLSALPEEIVASDDEVAKLMRDGQCRIDRDPVN
jgi:Nucleotidyl transferase AbiEii toxin, Type IV TA system